MSKVKFLLAYLLGFGVGLLFSEFMVNWVGQGPGPIKLSLMSLYIMIYGWPH